MIKKLHKSDLIRIISVYKNREIEFFPGIKSYSLLPKKSWIEFEWLEGTAINDDDIHSAFYILGKLHRKFIIKAGSNSVYTICHGDFHKNNIIRSDNKIMFIDTVYTHFGWNYTDLDYVDFYDLYDKEKYPWIIKDKEILESYLEGAKMNLSLTEKESFKKKAAVYALKKYIKNGIRNNINIAYEKKYLEKIINSSDDSQSSDE